MNTDLEQLQGAHRYVIPEEEKLKPKPHKYTIPEELAARQNQIESDLNRKKVYSRAIPHFIRVTNIFNKMETQKNLETTKADSEAALLLKIKNLKLQYSTNSYDVVEGVKKLNGRFIYDVSTIPEIQNANKRNNLTDTYLEIIKTLSVQTREEVKLEYEEASSVAYLQQLGYLKRMGDQNDPAIQVEWRKNFPNIPFPGSETIESLIIEEQIKLNSILYKKNNQPPKGIDTWNNPDRYSCNLYAATFIQSLGLQETFSHRVDGNNRPVLYVQGEDGKTYLKVRNKETGKLENARNVRELNAKGQLNWIESHGSEYGWSEVTDYSYDEKIKMLREGYIFFGGSNKHNWIVIGVEIDGQTIPMLTQSTTNYSMVPFESKEKFDQKYSTYNNPYQTDTIAHNPNYAAKYKLMPNLYKDYPEAKLFAIKVRK